MSLSAPMNFFYSSLGNEARARHITKRSRAINRVQSGLGDANICSDLPLAHRHIWYGKHICACCQFLGGFGANILKAAWLWGVHIFKVQAESFHSVLQNILIAIRSRKAALNVWKPNAVSAVFVFINNSKINHFCTFHIQPATLAICLATPEDKSFLGCGTVIRLSPLVNWWCEPTVLRNSQPSFLSRLITFLLSRSMCIYLHTTTLIVNRNAQINAQKTAA